MIIGGMIKCSFVDYPHKISTVIFTKGCNFRCWYCHNYELADSSYKEELNIKEIYDFLETRKNKIDAVVISGGEPTLHNDLKEVIKKIKEMGFLVKLDTNGYKPEVLKELINENLLDYVAMDMKAPYSKYKKMCRVNIDIEKLKQSANILINSNIDYEFRTTFASDLSVEDIKTICHQIKGAKNFYLQKYLIDNVNEIDKQKEHTDVENNQAYKIAKSIIHNTQFRNL